MPMQRELYPPDWEKIALAVKEAAGWKCEGCGKQCRKPGEPFDTHKRTLTVSHADHNPANCAKENLKALCAPCHLRYDAQHHADTRKRGKNMRPIDADAMRQDWLENGENEHVYDTNAFLDSIDDQPTLDVEPVRHGRWIPRSGCATCSVCFDDCWAVSVMEYNRCPNCGAKMDAKEK